MKNLQKGFVIPLIIALVALIAIAMGAYFLSFNNRIIGPGIPPDDYDGRTREDGLIPSIDFDDLDDNNRNEASDNDNSTDTTTSTTVRPVINDNLKVYTSEEYNFSFKYPNLNSISVEKIDSMFLIKGLSEIRYASLDVKINNNNQTIESEYNACKSYQFTDGHGLIKIGGKSAFWCTTTEMGAYYAVVIYGEYIYQFENFGLWERDIIDSFRFIK